MWSEKDWSLGDLLRGFQAEANMGLNLSTNTKAGKMQVRQESIM